MQTEGERKVERLLRDMGFDFVASNVVVPDPPKPAIGEVDLVFESGRTLLLVEVSEGRNLVSNKQWNFFAKWKDGPSLEALKEKLGLEPQRTIRAYFDLRPTPENRGAPETAGITGPRSMNKIYHEEDFGRLTEGVTSGECSKDDFLADFGLRDAGSAGS